MAIDLSRKQRQVLQIIQKYPEAANDDSLLMERFWYEIDNWDDSKSLVDNLRNCTRPETITRRRRELFNKGMIQYSDSKQKDRQDAYSNELEHFSNNHPFESAIWQ